MLKFWLSPAGLVIASLLAVVYGGVNTWKLSGEHIPARAELKRINGEIMRVDMTMMKSLKTGKASDMQYSVNIKQDNGEYVTLHAPTHYANKAPSDIKTPSVTALVYPPKDNQVWDLRAGSDISIEYDAAVRSASTDLQGKRQFYLLFLGGGALGILAGFFGAIAKRRRAASAA